jgi:hypothetical protein
MAVVSEELPSLELIVGEPLNAVTFVMDYVQFHFNGPILTALNHPVVEFRGMATQFPGPGSRDALCSLIPHEVESVDVVDGVHIKLSLASGHDLVIPLDPGSYIGPEAATFGDPTAGGLLVW